MRRVGQAAGGRAVNVLALSGGGSGGAFGAGALVGWSRLGTRPEFEIVTGVSSGALIAPLAFLGLAWDPKLQEAFSGTASDGLLRSHWIGALTGASVFQGGPLRDLVDRFVTDELLRAIAAENAEGRLLLIGTTDLDRQQLVIWDMGAIAARGGEPALELFRQVLIASASIPGVFPPVLIRTQAAGQTFDEMHVDGSTSAPLLVAPEMLAILPDRLQPLEGGNLYMLVNARLRAAEQSTPVTTLSVLKRSIATALESNTRATIELAYAFSQRHRMTVRVTEIPNNYPFLGLVDLSSATMKSLFDFGLRCALEQRLWADPIDALDHVARPVQAASGALRCPAADSAPETPVKADPAVSKAH